MKKTLTIVMALALAVSMLASFAFVLNPGLNDPFKPEKNPLVITGFFVTSNDAIVDGPRIYTPLVDNTNAAYAKNEIIRFAITMDVLNTAIPANGTSPALHATVDKPNELKVSSKTVDFTISNMAGQQALHVPFGNAFVNAIESKVANASTTFGGSVNTTTNELTIKIITAELPADKTLNDSKLATSSDPITLYAPTDVKVAKASYALIFSGITKGEITEQGLAKLVIASTPDVEFSDTVSFIPVVKNGRTYLVEKVIETTVTDVDVVKHPVITDPASLNPSYYTMTKVGYRVYLVTKETTTAYTAVPVAQLDTESIVWANGTPLQKKQVEGLGYSLGLEKIKLSAETVNVTKAATLTAPDPVTQSLVFRTVLSNGTVRYIYGDDATGGVVGADAFDDTELARLNTMLADFGFSTADNYTYKLEDKYFTTAGADTEVLTATYNNGTVVPVETEEETDVEEGTEEEELEEDEDIVEDIDEELEEDDEVPATGDFAADIALALTAAAIVAAAALAFVMKKARD